jgi:hypothetical protein
MRRIEEVEEHDSSGLDAYTERCMYVYLYRYMSDPGPPGTHVNTQTRNEIED